MDNNPEDMFLGKKREIFRITRNANKKDEERSGQKPKERTIRDMIQKHIDQEDKSCVYDYIINFLFYDNPNRVIYKASEGGLETTFNEIEKSNGSKIRDSFLRIVKREDDRSIVKIPSDSDVQCFNDQVSSLLRFNNIIPGTNTNLFDDFLVKYPNYWDYLEILIVSNIGEKRPFQDLTSNVLLYLYDNLKKIKEQKSIDHFRSKIRECGNINNDLSLLSSELTKFYNHRKVCMRDSAAGMAGKETEWTDEKSLIEILITSFLYVKFKGLTELDLSHYYIMHESITTVIAALKTNKTVTKLLLNSNKTGDEGLWSVGRLFNFNNNILELDVSLNMLTESSLKAFLTGLSSGTISLHKLNLSNNCNLTSESGEYIAEIVARAPYLKILNISKINLEKGFVKILKAMNKLQDEGKLKLETLIAIQIKLDNLGIEKLGEFMSSKNCPVKSLIMSDNKFNQTESKLFFNKMKSNTSVEELVLCNCEIGNELTPEIQGMIYSNTTLKILNLYNNKIENPKCFKAILKCLTSNYNNNIETYFSSNSVDKIILEDLESVDQFFVTTEAEISMNNNLDNFVLNPEEKNQKNEALNLIGKSLRSLDLSKNGCKLTIDDELIEILENINLDTLDITHIFIQDCEKEETNKKFKEVTQNNRRVNILCEYGR